MVRKRKITFVGPVTAGKHGEFALLLLQSGTEPPVEFEFFDKPSAIKARNTFLSSSPTYAVKTNKLLYAIFEALQLAVNGHKSDRPLIEDSPNLDE